MSRRDDPAQGRDPVQGRDPAQDRDPTVLEDPDWPRASDWLAGDGAAGSPVLAVLGVPLSQASISPSGAHETPKAIRGRLRRFSTAAADGADLGAVHAVDLGDLPLAGLDNVEAQAAVGAALRALPGDPRLPRPPDVLVLLGGDNALTRPALGALAGDDLAGAGLLTVDAHHDVRGFHSGPTNGTPVRGLIVDGLPGRHVVQLGIGAFTNSPVHRRWAEDAGVTVVSAAELRSGGAGAAGACARRYLDALAARCVLVYVDLDVDVLDQAYAPGCPGARAGGLAPTDLYEVAYAAGRHPAVGAVDIVEVDATADPTGLTVDHAALCLLHIAAGLAGRSAQRTQPGKAAQERP
jgi:formiminoglutamase